MSPDEIRIRIAEEIMGWNKDRFGEWAIGETPVWNSREGNAWRPDEDWNHFRQVEEKVMEDSLLYTYFIQHDTFDSWIGDYMKADLPTRVKALLSALDSLK